MIKRICTMSLVGLLAGAAAAQQPAPPSEPLYKPLPPMTWTPKHYTCLKAAKPIEIDGRLDEGDWVKAPWTDDFIDIEGPDKTTPRYRTRAKLLWDDNYLYIAAQMEEPNVKATLTQHDSIIFHDNDFEIFLKPLATQSGYFEVEVNALNTVWDLFLNKPYREGGKADSSWDSEGLKTAVSVQGTLNHPEDKDTGWTVEMALPWKGFGSRLQVPRPKTGTEWRINLSRVEWIPGHPREDNWVWTSQGVINMHAPDRWGYLEFRGKE